MIRRCPAALPIRSPKKGKFCMPDPLDELIGESSGLKQSAYTRR